MSRTLRLEQWAPAVFVLLWSTGWVVAGYAAPYADALSFLSVRYVVTIAVLLPFIAMVGARWPRGASGFGHALVSGILLHGIYLGAVWWAIRAGVPAGISGLIAAVQPLLTAMLAPVVLGERISRLAWTGVVVGFAGIVLVLAPKLTAGADIAASLAVPLAVNVIGMVSVTAGTFYQKRFVPSGDLRTVTALQYLGALAVTLPAALLLEPFHITWNATIVAVLLWSVAGLSLGAIALYLMLLRRGAVSRAAALVYLIPPLTAIEAWILFGERLSAVQIVGMVMAAAGVALARR